MTLMFSYPRKGTFRWSCTKAKLCPSAYCIKQDHCKSWPSFSQMVCEERDFQAAISMVKILVKHSSKVFNELLEEEKPATRKNRKQKYLDALPKNFNRQKYLEVAKNMNIPDKTAEGYITEFSKKGLIHRENAGPLYQSFD